MDNNRNMVEDTVLRRKLDAAKNPDSIFLPHYLAFQLRIADRIIIDIRRRVAIFLSIEQAREYIKEITDISDLVWDLAFKLIPRLATDNIEPRRWRELNDDYEIKLRQANRRAMSYIIPRTEEVGQLAMGFRLVVEKMMIMRQKAALEEIEDRVIEYMSIVKKFTPILHEIAIKANVSRDIIDKLEGKTPKKKKKDKETHTLSKEENKLEEKNIELVEETKE